MIWVGRDGGPTAAKTRLAIPACMSRTSVVTTPDASPANAPTALISRRCTANPCPPQPSHICTVSAELVSSYRSEHLRSAHLAERVGDELEACAVGVAEVQRNLAVLAELAIAAAGGNVVLTSRSQESADAAATQVNGSAAGVPAHAVDEEAARRCIGISLERFGSVDILIN